MRTSLNSTKEIDDHVLGLATPQDGLLFEANMVLNPQLRLEVAWHKQTLSLVQLYGRKQLRAEIDAVHQQLFNQPEHRSFRQSVLRFFKR
jgi:hypothetical protein